MNDSSAGQGPVDLGLGLTELMDVCWAAAFAEGRRNATHDTADGAAQMAMQALTAGILRDRATAIARDRQEAWLEINALIKSGDLGGNGCDMNAQRNGLVLAANVLMRRVREA